MIRNCSGGATPWNTWLSCEETDRGYVFETDPWGGEPVRRDAMGRFKHEAAAADPDRKVVYLTEDESDGNFYRFVPTAWGDMSAGTLQVLAEADGTLTWVATGCTSPRSAARPATAVTATPTRSPARSGCDRHRASRARRLAVMTLLRATWSSSSSESSTPRVSTIL